MPFIFRSSKSLVLAILTLFVIGGISRLLPLLNIDGRVLEQFPTEDGYLMLTIARNMALGMGMTTSDGTVATNGVQPLATFIWSLGYWLFDGDKFWGVVFAHLVQVGISIGIACYIYRLAGRVFRASAWVREIALVLSALVFASPHVLPHTMNFLETGLYLLLILIVLDFFYEEGEQAASLWTFRRCVYGGILLGLMFWARIDSVFIILAICLGHLFRGLPYGLEHIKGRFFRVLCFGGVSVVVALPWLVSNYLRFGSLMPVSGQSQGMAAIGHNLIGLPYSIIEYFMVAIPIPHTIQETVVVAIICTVGIGVICALTIYMWRNVNHELRTFLFIGVVVFTCFVVYYGVFFGALHFISRYMIVLMPFGALFTMACLLFAYDRLSAGWRVPLFSMGLCLLVVIAVGLNIRIYINGANHQHFQVVKWVETHVEDKVWVGAIQTGTLGYFHDRTINLDGKVNPEAMAARKGVAYCPENGRIEQRGGELCLFNYVLLKDVQYLADWVGIADWVKEPIIGDHFVVVERDPAANLAVLKRVR